MKKQTVFNRLLFGIQSQRQFSPDLSCAFFMCVLFRLAAWLPLWFTLRLEPDLFVLCLQLSALFRAFCVLESNLLFMKISPLPVLV